MNQDIQTEIECPKAIGEKVVYYAKQYVEKDTEYEWGGQDFLEKDGIIKMDCSGLIVNCVKYAIADAKYSLLFEDAAVINFYTEWTNKITNPRTGDLIFMGEDKIYPQHI
ncbi:MAG: hypothetical protein Ta2B_17050 [Termitinemataceae bacterium]|nr:MAG: hypothetical protein Ta2B_17050 [Termitinemataceae bacterium]